MDGEADGNCEANRFVDFLKMRRQNCQNLDSYSGTTAEWLLPLCSGCTVSNANLPQIYNAAVISQIAYILTYIHSMLSQSERRTLFVCVWVYGQSRQIVKNFSANALVRALAQAVLNSANFLHRVCLNLLAIAQRY